jgi:GTP-binding protein Era
MLQIVEQALEDADVVVLLLDGTRPPPEVPPEVLEALQRGDEPPLVAINKVDVASEAEIAELEAWARRELGAEVHRVSAEQGIGVEELRVAIARRLPESPYLYPEDDISTQSVRFFVAELIRETVFEQYQDEVPYSTAVRVEEFREDRDPILVRATVFVERPSQKGILIGKGGKAIRDLGSVARVKIEDFVQRPVYLDLWIKVLPKWRKSPVELRRFGFPVPET